MLAAVEYICPHRMEDVPRVNAPFAPGYTADAAR